MFVLSSLLIGQESETENSIYPKRTIVEPYDLDKGWFFYDDSVFTNSVLDYVLNNLSENHFKLDYILSFSSISVKTKTILDKLCL